MQNSQRIAEYRPAWIPRRSGSPFRWCRGDPLSRARTATGVFKSALRRPEVRSNGWLCVLIPRRTCPSVRWRLGGFVQRVSLPLPVRRLRSVHSGDGFRQTAGMLAAPRRPAIAGVGGSPGMATPGGSPLQVLKYAAHGRPGPGLVAGTASFHAGELSSAAGSLYTIGRRVPPPQEGEPPRLSTHRAIAAELEQSSRHR